MTQKMKKITVAVIYAAIAILLIYDAIAAYLGTRDATISWVTLTYAHQYPVIPFLGGFLCGHLFFSQNRGEF